MKFRFERSDFQPLLYYYLNNLPRRVKESSLGPADESSERSSSSAVGCPNDSHITKIVVYSRLFVTNQKSLKTEKNYSEKTLNLKYFRDSNSNKKPRQLKQNRSLIVGCRGLVQIGAVIRDFPGQDPLRYKPCVFSVQLICSKN